MDIDKLKKSLEIDASVILQIGRSDLFAFADKLIKDNAKEIEKRIKAENKPDELLTRKQVSKMLGVTLSTLWRWNKDGVLTATRIGNKVRYRYSDVEAAITKKK